MALPPGAKLVSQPDAPTALPPGAKLVSGGMPSTPAPPTTPNVSPGTSDDDIMRSFGYDDAGIARVKSSKRYQDMVKTHGSGLSFTLTDPNRGTAGILKDPAGRIANSPAGDLGMGFYDIPAGIVQLARHGANKLGMLSDADVEYGDLLDKVHNQDFLQNVRHGNANPLLRMTGNMLFPLPDVVGESKSLVGATVKGAVRGAEGGTLQPVYEGSPGDFAGKKVGQIEQGAAIGAGLGAVGHAAGKAASFVRAARSTELPENAAGRVAGNLKSNMEQTPWGNLSDVQKTAEEGGERAGAASQVLEQIQNADTPRRIMQASANAQRFRMQQASDNLYRDVEQAIEQYHAGDAPMPATAAALKSAESNAALGIKDTGLNSTLKEVRRIVTPEAPAAPAASGLVDASGKPIASPKAAPRSPAADYTEARKLSSQLEEIMRDKRTGENAVIGDRSIPSLQRIKDSIDSDLYNFTQKRGIPQLQAAGKMADDFYRQSVVPYKDINLARELSSDEADRIYKTFVQQGGADRAGKFYNALGQKGRAAVQYQMVSDAINKASDPVKGFNSGKFVKAMDGVNDAYGTFFRDGDKADVDALKNLVLQAAKVDAQPVPGVAGMALSAVPRSEKVLRFVTGTNQGRVFLYAARGLKPGPELSALYGQIENAVARGATSPGAQQVQSAPQPQKQSKAAAPAVATAQ